MLAAVVVCVGERWEGGRGVVAKEYAMNFWNRVLDSFSSPKLRSKTLSLVNNSVKIINWASLNIFFKERLIYVPPTTSLCVTCLTVDKRAQNHWWY